jgi:hypothetical protein
MYLVIGAGGASEKCLSSLGMPQTPLTLIWLSGKLALASGDCTHCTGSQDLSPYDMLA